MGATKEREEKILPEAQGALSEIKPFEVFLNGFGFSGAHRDVYLEVLNKLKKGISSSN